MKKDIINALDEKMQVKLPENLNKENILSELDNAETNIIETESFWSIDAAMDVWKIVCRIGAARTYIPIAHGTANSIVILIAMFVVF